MNVKLLKKKERKETDLPLYLFPTTHLPYEHFQFAFAPAILLKLQCLKDNADFSIVKYSGLFSSSLISLWFLTLVAAPLFLWLSPFIHKRPFICCCMTNQPNIKWLKTKYVLLFLVLLWVDWAQWGGSHSEFLKRLQSDGGKGWSHLKTQLG